MIVDIKAERDTPIRLATRYIKFVGTVTPLNTVITKYVTNIYCKSNLKKFFIVFHLIFQFPNSTYTYYLFATVNNIG